MRRRGVKEVLLNPRKDEYYVLVTRYYPKELRMMEMKLKDSPIAEWDKTLAPSKDLLSSWNSGSIDWREYIVRFMEEISISLLEKKVEEYFERALGKEIVLVCTEEDRDFPFCHTWLLLHLLKS